MIRSLFLFLLIIAIQCVFTPTTNEERIAYKHVSNHIGIEGKPTPSKTPRFDLYDTLEVEVSYYIALCKEGCTGRTATGYDVRNTISTEKGRGIIAVDPNVIPLYSIIEMDGKEYRALDTGGAIKGHRIDVLVASEKEARTLGRTQKEIKILKSKKSS